MAKVVFSKEVDVEELRRRGVRIFKRGGNIYLNSAPSETFLNIKGRPGGTGEARGDRYYLLCPYCGEYLTVMDPFLSMTERDLICSNRRCEKSVSLYELFNFNKDVIETFIRDKYKSTRKFPVIDPEAEFKKLLNEVVKNNGDIN